MTLSAHQTKHRFRHLINLGVFSLSLLINTVFAGANIVIEVGDGANEGFNDTTPVSPIGGNEGTSLGEQRLNVFRTAANNWARFIDSDVDVRVLARFNPLTCSSSSGVLGSAGPTNVATLTVAGAVTDTWYSIALANAIEERDMNGNTPEIVTTFNSNIDNNNSCLHNVNWYYGIDGNAPGYTIDLLAVVMHEIGHGLGFLSLMSANGSKFYSRNDIYSLHLADAASDTALTDMSATQVSNTMRSNGNLVWTGTQTNIAASQLTQGLNNNQVQMYAPSNYRGGSSVSHFDTAVSPNELMEPFATGPKEDPGLAVQLMYDLGWPDASEPVNTPPVISNVPANQDLDINHSARNLSFRIADAETSVSNLNVSVTSMDPSLLPNENLTLGDVDAETGNVPLTLTYELNTQGVTNVRIRVTDEAGDHADALFQYLVSEAEAEPEGPGPDAPLTITSAVLTQFDNIVRRYEAEYAEYESVATRLALVNAQTSRLYENWRSALQDVAATDSNTRAGSIALSAAAIAENYFTYKHSSETSLVAEHNADVSQVNEEVERLNQLISDYALDVTPLNTLNTTTQTNLTIPPEI